MCVVAGRAEGSCISAPSLQAAAPQEEHADGVDDDVLKQPAQRVPFDGANGAAAEDAQDGTSEPVHDDGGNEEERGSGRLAPATPDLDEDLQQSAAGPGTGYVSRETRTPYMERKIRELRVRRLRRPDPLLQELHPDKASSKTSHPTLTRHMCGKRFNPAHHRL